MKNETRKTSPDDVFVGEDGKPRRTRREIEEGFKVVNVKTGELKSFRFDYENNTDKLIYI